MVCSPKTMSLLWGNRPLPGLQSTDNGTTVVQSTSIWSAVHRQWYYYGSIDLCLVCSPWTMALLWGNLPLSCLQSKDNGTTLVQSTSIWSAVQGQWYYFDLIYLYLVCQPRTMVLLCFNLPLSGLPAKDNGITMW